MTAVASSGCPFSTGSPALFREQQCPISKSAPSRKRISQSSSTPLPSTSTLPPFRTPAPTSEILYLPPLLSLLPISHIPSHATAPSASLFFGFTSSRLPEIDEASVALHFALFDFRVRPSERGYALEDYDRAFNWDELRLPIDVQREWYIVAFRSKRAEGSVDMDLYTADREAHEEAVTQGGLLAYWYGAPDKGNNLATCIWTSRAAAIRAIAGPAHSKAMRLASEMYESYNLERYVLKKVQGEVGVTIDFWQGGEVEQS